MSRKAFHVGIDLDIHAVSCPGVWLCPKGDAMLRISMLGASTHTKRVEPCFPLLLHESFHFRKTFTGITSLAGLQAELTKRMVQIQLVQRQVHGCRCVLLAAFRSPLSELLYPQPASRGVVAGVDIDLLMEPTACFPGIISPKVEVSTKVMIEEMVNYPLRDQESTIINHKTLMSKKTGFNKEDKIKSKSRTKSNVSAGYHSKMRQKPVCHTKSNVKCYSCKQRVRGRAGSERPCDCTEVRPHPGIDTFYIPYCNKCGDAVEENGVNCGKIMLKDNSQHIEKWEVACPCAKPHNPKSACNCSLCLKYHNLFNNTITSQPESVLSQNPNTAMWRFSNSPPPSRKDKSCLCSEDKSADYEARFRGVVPPRSGCPCVRNSTWMNSSHDNGDCASEHIRKTTDVEYRNIFKADLDAHYKKLYERVSRRSNQRES